MERALKIAVDQATGRAPIYFGIGDITLTEECVRLNRDIQMAMDFCMMPPRRKRRGGTYFTNNWS